MAASCFAIEQMAEVQQEGLQGEEKDAEEIITKKEQAGSAKSWLITKLMRAGNLSRQRGNA